MNINIIFRYLLTITVFLIYTIYLAGQNLLLCEYSGPESEDTLFYKIEKKSSNLWEVLFKNVDRKYEVTSSEIPNNWNSQNFIFKESNTYHANCDHVNQTKTSINIKQAVMDHFNDIQRGNIHIDSVNYINPNAHGKGIRSPLDQFTIKNLISIYAPLLNNLKISYTNLSLYLTISMFGALFMNILAINYDRITANKWSLSQESIFSTIYSIVINQINEKVGQNYYPLLYSLFIFILINNLIGMVPYSFAPTSHFVLSFFLSFTVVVGSTVLGFFLHRLKFFSLFVPANCPLNLLPLLTLIEFISFLARNVSLGLRLAANILSGHMLLNILSEFTYKIMNSSYINMCLGVIPLMFIAAFTALELGIAFIQSQVFVVLSSSYIKDAIGLH